MNKLLYFGLVIGAAVAGAAVALYYTKDTERKRADEEIAQMREYYAQKEEKTGKTSTETEDKNTKSQEMRDYQKIVKKNYDCERTPDGPTVITPDEFGENPGYDKLSMTFYADNIVADENDEIVEDVNDCIGFRKAWPTWASTSLIFCTLKMTVCACTTRLHETCANTKKWQEVCLIVRG